MIDKVLDHYLLSSRLLYSRRLTNNCKVIVPFIGFNHLKLWFLFQLLSLTENFYENYLPTDIIQ